MTAPRVDICRSIADEAAIAHARIATPPGTRYMHTAYPGFKNGRGMMNARGCVYVIACATTGLAKIGWSYDPSRRLRGIQAACPTQLRLVTLIRGQMNLESRLHARYAEYREHGEWFRLPPSAIIELESQGRDD